MEKKQIKISNNINNKIKFSLEPEGTILELHPNHYLVLELSPSGKNPIINLQINKDSDDLYFSIWPENGSYSIEE